MVGLLRRLTRLPEETPGPITDIQWAHVDPGLVPGIVAVVPGGAVAATLSVVLLARLRDASRALQTAPILIAVVAAFSPRKASSPSWQAASRPAQPR